MRQFISNILTSQQMLAPYSPPSRKLSFLPPPPFCSSAYVHRYLLGGFSFCVPYISDLQRWLEVVVSVWGPIGEWCLPNSVWLVNSTFCLRIYPSCSPPVYSLGYFSWSNRLSMALSNVRTSLWLLLFIRAILVGLSPHVNSQWYKKWKAARGGANTCNYMILTVYVTSLNYYLY
jgi:hypothetical protein